MTDTPERKYDVFVSHSPADKAWVKTELVRRLEQAKLTVFVRYRDLPLGGALPKEIENGIKASQTMVAIFTASYFEQPWTEFESFLAQAADPASSDYRVIPIILEQTEIPLRFKHIIGLDFTQEQDWQRLIANLGRHVTKEAALPEPVIASINSDISKTDTAPINPDIPPSNQKMLQRIRLSVLIGAVLIALIYVILLMVESNRLNMIDAARLPPGKAVGLLVTSFGDPNNVFGQRTFDEINSLLKRSNAAEQIDISYLNMQMKDEEEAKEIAKKTNANMIIWGEYVNNAYSIKFVLPKNEYGSEITEGLKLSLDPAQPDPLAVIRWNAEVVSLFLQGLSAMGKESDVSQISPTMIGLATARFQSALQKFQEHPEWHVVNHDDPSGISDTLTFYVGRSLFHEGKFIEANLIFSQTLALNPNYTWAQLGRATSYHGQAVTGSFSNLKLQQAIDAYTETLDLVRRADPYNQSPTYAFVKAKAFYNLGSAYKARAIHVDRNSSEFTQAISQSLRMLEAALNEYTAIRKGGQTASVYKAYVLYTFGTTYELLGQGQQAQEHFRQCISYLKSIQADKAEQFEKHLEAQFIVTCETVLNRYTNPAPSGQPTATATKLQP